MAQNATTLEAAQPRDDDFLAAVQKLLKTEPSQDLYMFIFDEGRAVTTAARYVCAATGQVVVSVSVCVCACGTQAEAGVAAAEPGSDGRPRPRTDIRRQHDALQGRRLSDLRAWERQTRRVRARALVVQVGWLFCHHLTSTALCASESLHDRPSIHGCPDLLHVRGSTALPHRPTPNRRRETVA